MWSKLLEGNLRDAKNSFEMKANSRRIFFVHDYVIVPIGQKYILYGSRVLNYECKVFIRMTTGLLWTYLEWDAVGLDHVASNDLLIGLGLELGILPVNFDSLEYVNQLQKHLFELIKRANIGQWTNAADHVLRFRMKMQD